MEDLFDRAAFGIWIGEASSPAAPIPESGQHRYVPSASSMCLLASGLSLYVNPHSPPLCCTFLVVPPDWSWMLGLACETECSGRTSTAEPEPRSHGLRIPPCRPLMRYYICLGGVLLNRQQMSILHLFQHESFLCVFCIFL
jgi:hypothetical protein